MSALPRGIWYEAPKRRYRVRKYHNRVVYLKGYYRNLDDARAALKELEEHLATIPKVRRGSNSERPVSKPSVAGTADAISKRQSEDPNTMKRKTP